MLTKDQVEKAIEAIDKIVDEVLEYEGAFSYRTRELPKHWGEARSNIASCAADIIANKGQKKADKGKERFSGYGIQPVEVSYKPETTIEIARKSAVPIPAVRVAIIRENLRAARSKLNHPADDQSKE